MIFTENFLPFRETLRGSFQGASRVGVNWGYESTGAGDAWYPGDLPRPWLPALHTWTR